MDNDERRPPNPQAPLDGSLSAANSDFSAVSRQILALALPALGALVAEPLFTFIDSAMVGHLGTAQLAGMSLASQIIQTVVVLFIFLAYSTTSLTARAFGAGDPGRAVRAGVSAIWLAAGLGIASAIGLVLATSPLTKAMTVDASLLPHANAYLWTSAPGLVGMLMSFAAVGTLRGFQDTTTPLIVTGVGAAVNVALNALLIYGLGWGIAGSGAGTSATQLAMAGVYCTIIARRAHRLAVPLTPDTSGIFAAAKDGAPLIVRGLALRMAGLATIWPVSQLGSEPLAAYQVVLTVWTLTAFILDALAIAAQSLVGLAIGQGERTRLRTLLRVLALWGTAAGALLAVLVAIASPLLPRLFGSEAGMWPIATWGLIAAGFGLPFAALVFMLDGVLLGAGDNRFFAVAGVLQLLVYLPSLAFIDSMRQAGASAQVVVAAVWFAYGFVYIGARTVSNVWRTWFTPVILNPLPPQRDKRFEGSAPDECGSAESG